MRVRRIAAALSLAVVVCGTAARGEVVEQILVKVNGEIFTKTDLEQRQVMALRQRNRTASEADLKNDAALKQMLAEVTPQIVVDAVDELLLLQRGRELGLRLSDEQFAQILQNIRKENKLESEEQFNAALRQEGLTLSDLRRNIERQMIISRVQQQDVMDKISVTEAETKAYYEAHRNEFTTPAAVTLREILVAIPEAKPDAADAAAAEKEAQAKIEGLRARVTAGEDFAKIAVAESDAPSKANGGLIGPVNRDELAPAVQKLAETLKVGEVSQPIRGSRGFQLIKLESSSDTVMQPLDAVRNQVADRVFREKGRPELVKYLKKLREQAIIEWKSDEIRKVYEQRIASLEKPPATGS
jgi:peptidyl-prolyl cis-trans isomerase SurA